MFALPYSRFIQLKDFLIEKKEDEVREKYILQAFGAWLNGAGGKKKFNQFLKSLKLDKKKNPEVQKEISAQSKIVAKQNIDNAQRILMLDRQARSKKEG